MEWLGAAVLAALVLALVSIVVHSLRVGISPMPSSARAIDAMLSLIPPQTTGQILELGAGWGSVAVRLARHAPSAQVVAWESSWVPFAVAWLRVRMLRRGNLELHFGDFAAAPLTSATVVVCYLWPGAMSALSERFERELPVGASIVSNTFGLRGWAAQNEVELGDLYRTRVYRYVR